MEAQRVRIALHDASSGFEASLQRVELRKLKNYVRDVDEFLRGDVSDASDRDLEVSVVSGSIAVETYPIADVGLHRDLLRLSNTHLIDGLSARRRTVVERWQQLARKAQGLWVEIASPFLPQSIVINAESDYRADDADQWVRVERYVRGEIEDLGGHTRANAHLRLPDGKLLLVSTDRELLRADKVNRLYKPAMVRITAEYNVVTREYRGARLLEFSEQSHELDERQFKRLTDRGANAWADVPDATAWVERLRGNQA